MPTFEAQVGLATTAEALFDFLVHPANLTKIMPSSTPIEVIEGPDRLESGSTLVVDLDGFGPTQRLTYEVTAFDEPESFTETMVKGPLGAWVHRRTITSAGAMVELHEEVTFEPPEGLAGLLLTASRIEASLSTSFAHRHRRLRELLEAE
jgi:ligand-binding SRPBCC domain-containing protein